MRRHVLCALVLTAIGCSGAVDPTPQQQQKLAAANAHAQGTQTGDACAQNRWYGDGECDTFCADADSDCVPGGEAVVCAQFIEAENGVCDRPANDACRFQDPDCSSPSTPGGGGNSGSTPGGVACALVSEVPNNHCDRPASDPCRFQDPDCNAGSTEPTRPDCDTSKVICQTFAPVVCPDGQVPTVVNGCYGPCVDKEVCSGKGTGTGGSTGAGGDPGTSGGSSVGGAPSSSGGNSAAGNPGSSGGSAGGNPGSSGGSSAGGAPSSSGGNSAGGNPGSSGGSSAGGAPAGGSAGAPLYDCDPRKITCQTLVAVTCPAGQVPTVLNNCYGMCVPKEQCEPIICLTYIEKSDGVCSRPANDPCRGQDPDCTPDPVVCAQYIEASDNVCSRPADDPCLFQDPDCKKP